MRRPWEIPHLAEPHHALPLEDGLWRGPRPAGDACTRALEDVGVRFAGANADGAARWRVDADARLPEDCADGDPADPAWRAHWIGARLGAARAAYAQALPVPRMLGILNLTPDSFSDGGRLMRGELVDAAAVRAAASRLRAEGADALDLGAESTRPGAEDVPAETQVARLLPALEAAAEAGLPLSVDTRSAAVAHRCLQAGADLINDVSGLADPAMPAVLAEHGCTAILMHMRGTPRDMGGRAVYRDLFGEVADELMDAVARARAGGVDADRLILDPGLGFAKSPEQTRALVRRFGAFRALGLPLLAGPSRKSFLRGLGGGAEAAERDGATAGAAALCAAGGATWLRLHRGGWVWEAARAAAGCAREGAAEAQEAPA